MIFIKEACIAGEEDEKEIDDILFTRNAYFQIEQEIALPKDTFQYKPARA